MSESESSDFDGDNERQTLVATEQRQNSGTSKYEDALAACGVGKFHWMLVCVCGWALASESVEILSVSFVLPSTECDLHMSSFDKGLLNASIFVGMMVGGYVWGAISDVRGRRAVLIWSLLLNGTAALASSAAQGKWLFIALRIVSGIGVGGSMPTIFAYFVEFLPAASRGTWISGLATFWMGGNIFAAGLAWAVVPHRSLGYITPSFTYNSWRIFIALCTLPSLSSSLIFLFMPESPKIYLKKGRTQEALNVFRQIYKRNKGRLPRADTYPFQTSHLEGVGAGGMSEERPQSRIDVYETTTRIVASTAKVFRRPHTRSSVIMTVVNFALAFGYYGLWMWFPQLFAKIEENGGSVCSPVHNSNSSAKDACATLNNTAIYFDSFLTASANLPGNLLTIFLMDRIGRRFLLAGGLVVSGISVFFIYLVSNKTENLIVSCIFGGISTVGFNALDVLTPELYPTELRATANGVFLVFARLGAILGNLLFGLMVNVHCIVPLLTVASLMTFAGLCALKLPETTGVDID